MLPQQALWDPAATMMLMRSPGPRPAPLLVSCKPLLKHERAALEMKMTLHLSTHGVANTCNHRVKGKEQSGTSLAAFPPLGYFTCKHRACNRKFLNTRQLTRDRCFDYCNQERSIQLSFKLNAKWRTHSALHSAGHEELREPLLMLSQLQDHVPSKRATGCLP